MAEYIEREAAIRAVYQATSNPLYRIAALNIPDMIAADGSEKIESIPAADVAPVRRGRWISAPHKRARICSECHADEPYKFADTEAEVFAYCPNCGAKMEET